MKFIVLTAFVAFNVYGLVRFFRPKRLPPPVLPLPRLYKKILADSFPYYRQLPVRLRGKFERRVMGFITAKKFISRDHQIKKVTPEMKVLIAASAVQLTFGLPYIELVHFNRILIYQDDYYSRISRRYHKGETNPMFGVIVLSWNNFTQGMFHTDGVNLGLHEMAHALHLENGIRNAEHSFLSNKALDRWEELALEKIAVIRQGNNRFLRDYGGVNYEEFFAVSVEAFFEKPEAFREHLPGLYQAMVDILLQDPLRLDDLHTK
ncbi:MAG: zinc-dependent peptidase [Cyclobacteriaceae bacterium]